MEIDRSRLSCNEGFTSGDSGRSGYIPWASQAQNNLVHLSTRTLSRAALSGEELPDSKPRTQIGNY